MFGYIKPYKPELKLKEIVKYSNAYCALCDQLKCDYGLISTFILSFDITFLLLCLDYFYDGEKECRKIRCPYNPMKSRKVQLSRETLRYSAFINYWLVTEKLYDDYTDDKNYFKGIFRKVLTSNRQFKKNKAIYESQVQTLESMLHQVYKSEINITNSIDFDKATNAFGKFFAEIFNVIQIDTEDKILLKKLFFQVGKWIYIIDAYDDFEKDVKKNQFNLLYALAENDTMEKKEVFEKVFSIHLQLKQKIDLLLKKTKEFYVDECVINVLNFGLDDIFYKITKKKYKEYLGELTGYGNGNMEQMDAKN